MARPFAKSKKVVVNARLPQEIYNSIVSYQVDRNISTFTKAVEEVLSYGILYYYTNDESPSEL